MFGIVKYLRTQDIVVDTIDVLVSSQANIYRSFMSRSRLDSIALFPLFNILLGKRLPRLKIMSRSPPLDDSPNRP